MMPSRSSDDATVRSDASSSYSQTSLMNSAPKEGKVKAYVDFTEFNRNYEEYLKQQEREKAKEEEKEAKNDDAKASSQKSTDGSDSRSSEDWVVVP